MCPAKGSYVGGKMAAPLVISGCGCQWAPPAALVVHSASLIRSRHSCFNTARQVCWSQGLEPLPFLFDVPPLAAGAPPHSWALLAADQQAELGERDLPILQSPNGETHNRIVAGHPTQTSNLFELQASPDRSWHPRLALFLSAACMMFSTRSAENILRSASASSSSPVGRQAGTGGEVQEGDARCTGRGLQGTDDRRAVAERARCGLKQELGAGSCRLTRALGAHGL